MATGADDPLARDELFTRVSGVRVTSRLLLRTLAALTEAAEKYAPATSGSTMREAALKEALARGQKALDAKQLATQQSALRKLLEDHPSLHGYAEDTWAVVNDISGLLDRWPKAPAGSAPDAAATIAAAKDSAAILTDVVLHCSKVTVPEEVEEQLIYLRVGKPLDFDDAFEEQLPDTEQRKRVLSGLKHKRIGGWVDVGAGLIYRLPRSTVARVLTCIAPFLLALLAAALMYGVPTLSLPSDWNLNKRWELVGAFGLVLLGAVIHLLVENVKQMQTRSLPIVAISDGIYWLNLRWLGLALTVLWALVVAIGLRVAEVGPNDEGIALYIAAGYSLDSVAGLVLTRFDSTAGVLLKKVNKQLEVPGDQSASGKGQAAAATATG
jgi:hypothetical protein